MSHPPTMDPLISTSAKTATQSKEEAEALRLNGAAVLIVDEDPAFQLGLKTFLKEYVGFSEVHTARDGVEALERIASTPSIEIVTLDYKMPRMDGLEFLTRLQSEAPRSMSVIMITGYPSDQLEEQFRSHRSERLHTEYFLTKPIEFEKLETVILDSYESLKKAQIEAARIEAEAAARQEAGDTAPVAEALSVRMEGVLRRILERLDSLEGRVAALAESAPAVMPAPAPVQITGAPSLVLPREPLVARLAKSLLKGILLIVFAWAVVRHGLLDHMLESFGLDPESWFLPPGKGPAL